MAKREVAEIEKNIKEVIESDILPMLRMDGGGMDFLGYKNGVVKVKLSGACSCCPMSEITLKGMVEAILKDSIPEVKSVEDLGNLEENFEDKSLRKKSTKTPLKPLKTRTSKEKSLKKKSIKARKK